MTTLKDIAKLTGVSVNTVSRALKNKSDIGGQTTARVQEVARRLGYRPNLLARGLALKRTFTIGLVTTELHNPTRSAQIEALRARLLTAGYQLLVHGYSVNAEIDSCVRDLTSRGVDGLVLGNVEGILAEAPCWPALETARQAGTPVVVFFQAVSQRVDTVYADFGGAASRLAKHLVEVHGLQDIKYAGVTSESDRYDGYCRALTARGLANAVGCIPLAGCSPADARRGIHDYLTSHQPPDAVVCHNDLAAFGVLAGLRDAGLSVPRDVAVVGLDNIELSAYMNPALTTAGLAADPFADTLFQLLQKRIAHKTQEPAQRVELPFQLQLRESCGCTNQTTGVGRPRHEQTT